jgi:hypothetical protein
MRFRVQYNPALGKYKIQLKQFWWMPWVDMGSEYIEIAYLGATTKTVIDTYLYDSEDEAFRIAREWRKVSKSSPDKWQTVKRTSDYTPR